jgi:hypothetical protein
VFSDKFQKNEREDNVERKNVSLDMSLRLQMDPYYVIGVTLFSAYLVHKFLSWQRSRLTEEPSKLSDGREEVKAVEGASSPLLGALPSTASALVELEDAEGQLESDGKEPSNQSSYESAVVEFGSDIPTHKVLACEIWQQLPTKGPDEKLRLLYATFFTKLTL